MSNIEAHRAVQAIAKGVLAELASMITAGDTEQSIAQRATQMMAKCGAHETWYYNCPALVLLGSRSCLSVSGREYQPSSEVVGQLNLVTVDLSPSIEGVWGDCARSFVVENGRWTASPNLPEFQEGIAFEQKLHARMLAAVKPDMRFMDLFEFANAMISAEGFENLDFLGNVGHSIESTREHRRYIEKDNDDRLGEVGLFTFEPHIRKVGGAWGFKHENIYYFGPDGRAVEL
ncbi:M24 family metallopeptidase [Luteimonas sp. RD2P54]|uniref:M24 family metallopeptidase n=1 Tax=Luteimonas endophytica TaxID=3042023 RepID=A0ABT6J568_9GAMM|nr:M24 family metallopeptidase [Luteimonas endophytica]MDH5821914.1 M24 family metallopeptidase [Luteimonas endophytica]